jgi:ribonuclease HI
MNTNKFPNKVEIVTDGAYSKKRNIGGYAYILQFLKYDFENEEYRLVKEKQFSEQVIDTTSNRMEILAAIKGLNALTRPCIVEIFSDATYLTNTINLWITSFIKDRNRLNYDLMTQLYDAIKKHKSVKATWIKGHSNNVRNDRANELAQKAAETWKGKT